MFDGISLGSERIIAPMVETAYALKKFMGAIKIACLSDNDVEFLINLETITAFHNFDKMLLFINLEAVLAITKQDKKNTENSVNCNFNSWRVKNGKSIVGNGEPSSPTFKKVFSKNPK